MASEEETARIRAPEPVTITVVRCRNLVSELANCNFKTRSSRLNFILSITLLQCFAVAIGLAEVTIQFLNTYLSCYSKMVSRILSLLRTLPFPLSIDELCYMKIIDHD